MLETSFLSDPTDVPPGVVKHLAAQLSVADPASLKRYLDRPASHREHSGEIQRRLGYRDFNDQLERFRLLRWLYTRAWLSAERPTVLFDLTTARLIERKILLPGVTVLTRLIARVRDRADCSGARSSGLTAVARSGGASERGTAESVGGATRSQRWQSRVTAGPVTPRSDTH